MVEAQNEEPATLRSPRTARSHVVFALIAVALAAGAIGGIQSLSPEWLDYDYQNVTSYIIAGIAFLVVLGRICLRVPMPLAARIGLPLILLGLPILLFRPVEFDGDMRFVLVPRFAAQPDELLEVPDVARDPEDDLAIVDLTRTTEIDYPRFLGADGRATLHGLSLSPDWANREPRLMWRQPIGAGWSAFSIVGSWAVTQEQRGEEELVTCYAIDDGKLMWVHRDPVRFSETLGGVGPRATPTIDEGLVYTQGATGILNCLDGVTGKRIWSRNIITENQADQITWGRSGSPLIEGSLVVVSAGGPNGKSLVAYHKETGEPVWSGGSDRASYASPVATTLAGVRQIVTVNENWVVGHHAVDGKVLWEHPWPGSSDSNASTSQPVPIGDDRVFISGGYGRGCLLIQIERAKAGEQRTAAEEERAKARSGLALPYRARKVWSNATLMKTKMSNVVIRDGHGYGLSGGILECIDLSGPKRCWKRGRYGHGQIVLVDDLIVVLTEKGELALVDATPDRFHERARMAAIEGKTWNNPAMSGRRILIRNHQEAACYELPIRAK